MNFKRALLSLCAIGATLTSALPAMAVPNLINGSFEANGSLFVQFPGYIQPNNALNPASITGWTNIGNGVGVNSGVTPIDPFANNGDTPADGTFAAFLQASNTTTTLEQAVSGFDIGKRYYVTYRDNARSGGAVSVAVSASGIGVIDASHSVPPVGGANPYLFDVTNVFTATATTHTLSFAATGVGDQTLLLDNVRIHEKDALPDSGGNLGFETVDNNPTFAANAFRYDPAGASWTFQPTGVSGGTGIAGNGSDFNNATAPEGTKVALIQQTSSFSDVFYDFDPSRRYSLTFSEAIRPSGGNDFEVLLDGQVIFVQHIPAGTAFATVTSPLFNPVDAGNDGAFILQFRGINSLGGDRTSFVDNISFALIPIPEPATATLGLLSVAGLMMRRRRMA